MSRRLMDSLVKFGRDQFDLKIDFREQEAHSMLLARIKRTGEFLFLDSDRYETRLAMIVGGRGNGVAWGGGYMMEVFETGTTRPVCLVLGHERDMQTNRIGQPGMEPVFICHQGEGNYVVRSGGPEFYGPAFGPEAVLAHPSVVKKAEAIVEFIASHTRENHGGVVVANGPRSAQLVASPKYAPVQPRRFSVIGTPAPVTVRRPETMGAKVSMVRSLSEEIAAALGADRKDIKREMVAIESMPANLPVEVAALLVKGVETFREMGCVTDHFTWGGEYEDIKKKEKVWWIREGDSRQHFNVMVKAKLGTEECDLVMGLQRDFQLPGQVPMTAAVNLCFENGGSEISERSIVEALIYPTQRPARYLRSDFSAKDGHLMGQVGGDPDPEVVEVFSQVFPNDRYLFRAALGSLWYFAQEKPGWLGG